MDDPQAASRPRVRVISGRSFGGGHTGVGDDAKVQDPDHIAELRYGLAFGSSVEEIADFLQRDVDDVRHQIEVQVSPRPNR